jgi:hypothetical protein
MRIRTLPAVLSGPLRAAGTLASAVVLVSFLLFAVDEARTASDQTAAEIEGRRASRTADPSPAQERDRERAHGTVRETIDDVDDVLVAPFASLVPADANRWARRGVPMVLALLVYGFGLGFLARMVRLR